MQLTSEARKISILVIDDASTMRVLLSSILKSFGVAKVYDAPDAIAAFKELDMRPIDLIFCDWEMPHKTGLEFFNELKQHSDFKAIPFVLVTSVADMDKVKVAIQSGVEHYIVKPFKEATLMDKLNSLFP